MDAASVQNQRLGRLKQARRAGEPSHQSGAMSLVHNYPAGIHAYNLQFICSGSPHLCLQRARSPHVSCFPQMRLSPDLQEKERKKKTSLSRQTSLGDERSALLGHASPAGKAKPSSKQADGKKVKRKVLQRMVDLISVAINNKNGQHLRRRRR